MIRVFHDDESQTVNLGGTHQWAWREEWSCKVLLLLHTLLTVVVVVVVD
jgi:hypothetical protein